MTFHIRDILSWRSAALRNEFSESLYFTALGMDVMTDDATNHGRIDLTVKLEGLVFILSSRPVTILKTKETIQADFYRRLAARGYYVSLSIHLFPPLFRPLSEPCLRYLRTRLLISTFTS